MVTLRVIVGFILLLIVINPLESTLAWRQTRQINTSDVSETRNKSSSNIDNAAADTSTKRLDNKHFNELIISNETIKNDDIKKPKTENNVETLKILRLNERYNNGIKINKNETSPSEQKDKEINKKVNKETRGKDKLIREESGRSIDLDIDKFTSPEFHNKNNVYTLPVSASIKKYVEAGYDGSTTETLYKHSRYANDYNFELTTPKSPFFDLKHRQIEEGVQQNLDEFHSYFARKDDEEHRPNVSALLDKVNNTNVQLDYKTFKDIEQNKTADKSSIREDILTQKGTKLYFNETYNETKIIDEQNIIPITGPDHKLNDNIKLDKNLSHNVSANEIASSSSSSSSTKSNNNESATTKIESERKDKIKPFLPVTDKPTINHLTKPPALNKTSSLISNKIEVEKIKPIDLDVLKINRLSNNNNQQENKTIPHDTITQENQILKTLAPTSSTTTETLDVLNTTETLSINTTEIPILNTTVTTVVEANLQTTDTPNLNVTTTETITTTTSSEIFNTKDVTESTPITLPSTLTSTEQQLSTLNEIETTLINQMETKTDAETSVETSATTTEDSIVTTDESTTIKTTDFIETTTLFSSSIADEAVTTTYVDDISTTISIMMNESTTVQEDLTTMMPTTEVSSSTTPNATVFGNTITKSPIVRPILNHTNHVTKATEKPPQHSFKDNQTNTIKNLTSTDGSIGNDFEDEEEDDYVDNQPKTTNHITKQRTSSTTETLENVKNNSLNEDGLKKKNNIPIDEMTTTITTTLDDEDITTSDNLELPKEDNDGKVIAIIISCVGAVCLIALVILLIIMRKRQKRFNYGQRCTPVSLDDYSMDNVSVYNSVRRKGVLRISKRSYGNPAFEDPSSLSNQLNFSSLVKFCDNIEEIRKEFDDIPQVTTRTNEVPEGCEIKNRYANVIPLPETRVFLNLIDNYPNSDYINANYVTGPKGVRNYYIACQAPMQNTVEDFWRMIWEQQSKVILMLTHIFENGAEKSFDYLPPSEVSDCQRLFGDLQIILKKREVKTKYIISTIQLKNMISNSWREVTHLWYIGWPEKGVPEETNSIITFLIEARSYLKIALNTGNNHYTLKDAPTNGSSGSNQSAVSTSPMIVHCSPGTGRTGTVIACDIAIREFELTRQVDIPKIVYKIRRDRASSVQTRDQYAFIYKVIGLYATKLTGGGLDSI